MRSIFTLCGIVIAGSSLCPADDNIRTVLAAAEQQQIADLASGTMRFHEFLQQPDYGQETKVSGRLEWDEDYLFWDGLVRQKRRTPDGTRETTRTARVLRSRGLVLARLEDVPAKNEEAKVFLILRNAQSRSSLDAFMPDPRELLFSVEALRYCTTQLATRPDPVNPAGTSYDRTFEINGDHVTVTCTFSERATFELQFSLNQGGLCTEHRHVHRVRGEDYYDVTRRELSQTGFGAWFPKRITSESRRGSWDGRIRGTSETTIETVEPLERRSYPGTPTLTTFGPIPKRAFIEQLDASGNVVRRKASDGESGDFEDRLRKQAESLRQRGTANPRPAGDRS